MEKLINDTKPKPAKGPTTSAPTWATWRASLGLTKKEFRAEYKSDPVTKAERAQLGAPGRGYHWAEFVNKETGGHTYVTQKNPHKSGNFFVKTGRNFARVMERPSVYINSVASGVVTYFGGPILGEAAAAGLSEMSYSLGSTAARARGKHGREARAEGRRFRERSFMSSQYAIGLGGLAAGVAAGTVSATQAGVSVATQGAKLGLNALAQRNGSGLVLSQMPVGVDMSGARDAGSIMGGQEPASESEQGGGRAGLGLVLIAAGLLLERKSA